MIINILKCCLNFFTKMFFIFSSDNPFLDLLIGSARKFEETVQSQKAEKRPFLNYAANFISYNSYTDLYNR